MGFHYGNRRALFGSLRLGILDVLYRTTGYLAVWDEQETSGAVAVADNIAVPGEGVLESSRYPGAEELSTAGASGTATAANWTVNTGTPSNPSVGILRNTFNGTTFPRLTQDVITPGVSYQFVAQARGDGTGIPRFMNNGVVLWLGTSSTDWQDVNIQFIAGNDDVWLSSVLLVAGYTEWRNISVKPANPLNGDHTAVAVGQTGQYRVPIVVEDDGATTYTDFLSTEYNSIYDPTQDFTKYSLMRKTTWDTTERYLFYDYVDANNYTAVYTSTIQDQVVGEFMAGGVLEQITWDSAGSTDLMLIDIGRDSGVFKMRVNGTLVGSEAIAGTFVGNFTIMVGGAKSTTPTNVHLGQRAYMGNNSAYIPDAEMLAVVQSMGIPT
jgi:hypothetical protein